MPTDFDDFIPAAMWVYAAIVVGDITYQVPT
jgi:hypothetical protein